jgi:transcriptional regulator with XRE-family HTH domain
MIRVAAERYAKGETMAELAEVHGVSEPTIWRALQCGTSAVQRVLA